MIKLTNINYLKAFKKAVPLLMLIITLNLHGQGFNAPDIICISDSLKGLEYTGLTPKTYNWNFCIGNLALDPTSENFDCGGTLNDPAYIDFFEDPGNGTYYTFVTNQADGSITRNYYGTDPMSDPISDKLAISGASLPNPLRGISIIQRGSDYYAFVVGGDADSSKIVRIYFSNTLSAPSPLAINLGNIGDLNGPSDLKIINNGGFYKGYILNQESNTLTFIDFVNGIYNTPNGTNIGNPNGLLIHPTGLYFDQEPSSRKWFVFVANRDGDDIVRVDFGSLISNPSPTAVSLGGSSVLDNPLDITVYKECEGTYGFITNSSNEIVRFELLTNEYADNNPVFENLGAISNLSSPMSISNIFLSENTYITYIANTDANNVTRLSFLGCDNATPSSWTVDSKPPAIHYDQPGTYNIFLLADEKSYCQNVEVLPNPRMELGNDTAIKGGASIVLEPDSTYYAYRWKSNNIHDPVNSSESSIEVDRTGTYTLTVTDESGCSTTDAIDIVVDIGIPNFFTPNNDSYNDTWEIPLLYSEPESEVMVFDRFGNIVAQYKAGDGFWDGKSNGRLLPQGTYWYVIKVPGTSKPYKGSISIKY